MRRCADLVPHRARGLRGGRRSALACSRAARDAGGHREGCAPTSGRRVLQISPEAEQRALRSSARPLARSLAGDPCVGDPSGRRTPQPSNASTSAERPVDRGTIDAHQDDPSPNDHPVLRRASPHQLLQSLAVLLIELHSVRRYASSHPSPPCRSQLVLRSTRRTGGGS